MKINSLCRGGVVLLSSHIEGYIEEIGQIALERIFVRTVPKAKLGNVFKYHLSKDLIRDIKGTEDQEKIVSKLQNLFLRDGHIWDFTLIFTNQLSYERFIDGFSNPTHDRIKSFFNRFGYKNFEGDLAHRLQRNFPICKNMIDQVIRLRNDIAHGNFFAPVTPNDIGIMVVLTKLYCRETDCVVGDWFKSIDCPIR